MGCRRVTERVQERDSMFTRSNPTQRSNARRRAGSFGKYLVEGVHCADAVGVGGEGWRRREKRLAMTFQVHCFPVRTAGLLYAEHIVEVVRLNLRLCDGDEVACQYTNNTIRPILATDSATNAPHQTIGEVICRPKQAATRPG